MTSPITTNISAAATQAANNPAAQAAIQQRAPAAMQAIASTQAASERQIINSKSDDKERVIRVPKRTEGAFANKETQDKRKGEGNHKLDVVA